MYARPTGVKEMPPKRKSTSRPSSNAKRFATVARPFLKKWALSIPFYDAQTVTDLLFQVCTFFFPHVARIQV